MKPLVICVVGARPQFVKHKPVLEAFAPHFEVRTLHTCQHYDESMSQVFFDELEMPAPEYMLKDTVRNSQHGAQTASMLVPIEQIFFADRPAAAVVYGDTNSTLAGALVAAKLHVPVVHIEAGLRSFNRDMPEEVNRVVTDHLSALLFAPTPLAVRNLAAEGITRGVHHTGDVMCDVLLRKARGLKALREGRYVFATIHRPYNTDVPDRLRAILTELNGLSCPVVFPLHPRTRGYMQTAQLAPENFPNIHFIEPMGYEDCLAYQKFAACVVTDSGGIQKEAYLLNRRCVTLRTETEWVETLENGCNTLLGDDLSSLPALLDSDTPLTFGAPYGRGAAASEMARLLLDYLAVTASA